jgi:hypothetical protein
MKQKLSKNQYLYKRLGLGEVKNPQYFLNSYIIIFHMWYPYPSGVTRKCFFWGFFFCWAFMLYNESSRHVRKFGLSALQCLGG